MTGSADKPRFEGNLILEAMATCSTVEEVLELFSRYDLSMMEQLISGVGPAAEVKRIDILAGDMLSLWRADDEQVIRSLDPGPLPRLAAKDDVDPAPEGFRISPVETGI